MATTTESSGAGTTPSEEVTAAHQYHEVSHQCSACGLEIPEGAHFCPGCGGPAVVGQRSTALPPVQGASYLHATSVGTQDSAASTKLVYPRNPPLSPHVCWINLLLPGVAQMIHGQVAKGIVLAVVALIAIALPPALLGLIVVSILDAYKVGKVLKQGRPVGKWESFPSAGGSIMSAQALLHFTCPQCGEHLKAPGSMKGKQSTCPRCHKQIKSPDRTDGTVGPLDPLTPASRGPSLLKSKPGWVIAGVGIAVVALLGIASLLFSSNQNKVEDLPTYNAAGRGGIDGMNENPFPVMPQPRDPSVGGMPVPSNRYGDMSEDMARMQGRTNEIIGEANQQIERIKRRPKRSGSGSSGNSASSREVTCPLCHGSGYSGTMYASDGKYIDTPCSQCGGRGHIKL